MERRLKVWAESHEQFEMLGKTPYILQGGTRINIPFWKTEPWHPQN